MPTELRDEEEIETLDISDDEVTDDSHAADDDLSGDELTDRGDDFVDPEAEDEGEEKPDANPEPKAEEVADKESPEDEPETDDKGTGVPFQRLNEVARVKTASIAIADAMADGLIDPAVIKELGGANVVAKALVNREITIDELQTLDTNQARHRAPDQPSIPADQQNTPANWDMDAKYVEYQELVDAGEVKEAATLLRQINKEERARERNEEQAAVQHRQLTSYVEQVMSDHPTLADINSQDHEDVKVWTDHYQAKLRIPRIEALQRAVARVFGKIHTLPIEEKTTRATETEQQRVIRERKEAATRRGAKASSQQPPNMGLGAAPQGQAKLDFSKMTEEEFERHSKQSPEEKRRARGDFV